MIAWARMLRACEREKGARKTSETSFPFFLSLARLPRSLAREMLARARHLRNCYQSKVAHGLASQQIERRSVTSRYYGKKISGSQKRNSSKNAIGLDWQKNNFASASRFYAHFLTRFLHDCEMKLSNFTCPLYRVGEHNTKNFFFFF